MRIFGVRLRVCATRARCVAEPRSVRGVLRCRTPAESSGKGHRLLQAPTAFLFQISNGIPRRLIWKEKGRLAMSRPLFFWVQLGSKTTVFLSHNIPNGTIRATESTRPWRKRVGVEPTIRLAKSRIAGFEGREDHRTLCASVVRNKFRLQSLLNMRNLRRFQNQRWCYCGANRFCGVVRDSGDYLVQIGN